MAAAAAVAAAAAAVAAAAAAVPLASEGSIALIARLSTALALEFTTAPQDRRSATAEISLLCSCCAHNFENLLRGCVDQH